jgi:hypothetical protein
MWISLGAVWLLAGRDPNEREFWRKSAKDLESFGFALGFCNICISSIRRQR